LRELQQWGEVVLVGGADGGEVAGAGFAGGDEVGGGAPGERGGGVRRDENEPNGVRLWGLGSR